MNIIREVANKNGVSEKEVRKEMKIAIRAAMQSTDPIAQFFWKQIAPDGREPSIDKVIAALTSRIQNNSFLS